MRRRVIRPTRLSAAGLGVFAMSWFLIAPIADAATARADLKDAGGVKVGEASLQDTPQGVKVSATFTDLPAGEHAFHVHAVSRCEPPFESAVVSRLQDVVSRLQDEEIMNTPDAAELGFKRALVPLDGSMVAEAILPSFLRLAHPLGMEVALIRVVVPTVKPAAIEETSLALGNTAPPMERMQEEAEAYLRAVAATPAFEGLQVLTTVRSGEAPQEIIASARELQADVIAMTTHGRTGLRRLLFGSVAEAVLRMADVPVFMLRAAHLEA